MFCPRKVKASSSICSNAGNKYSKLMKPPASLLLLKLFSWTVG